MHPRFMALILELNQGAPLLRDDELLQRDGLVGLSEQDRARGVAGPKIEVADPLVLMVYPCSP
jgi:hypothetical protein